MAVPMTRTDVANVLQTYIHRRALFPLAWSVPLNEMADVFKLPVAGDVLRVPRIKDLTEATSLSKDSVYDVTNTTGMEDIAISYDDYTMTKRGKVVRINDFAVYTSLLQLADVMSEALNSAMARTMNSDCYDALVAPAGLQFVLGHTQTNAAEASATCTSDGTTTTTVSTALTQIDDYWNNAQITYTSGHLAGLSRKVTDFVASSDTLTHDAFPEAPLDGDAFTLTTIGNAVSNGPDDIATSDTITLPGLYKAFERPRRFGAGSMRAGGPTLSVAGVRRDNSADVARGVAFMPTPIAHDLKVALAGGTAATDVALFQTSEGFRRAVGGKVEAIGGCQVVEVNHYKRMAIADASLSNTSGTGWPVVVLFKGAFGTTVLRDNPGNRQGLSTVVKRPGKNDMAVMFDSIKLQGEQYVINKYFPLNALWGSVLWVGTTTAP